MIDVVELDKKYGKVHALRRVDLHLSPGRVTGVIGPNGSGKTTLMKCILGLTKADAGDVYVNGGRIDSSGDYRCSIGYMPQSARFPDNLSGRDVIQMVKSVRTPGERIDDGLVDDFDLTKELDKASRTLSGGNRQKLSAVIAFLFSPSILILDEPTAGLDPVASGVLKDRIRWARDAGKTILLTSHFMAEVEELADDIVFLLEGRVEVEGSVEAVKQAAGESRLERAVARLMRGERLLWAAA